MNYVKKSNRLLWRRSCDQHNRGSEGSRNEGYTTDYQSPQCLHDMCRDGIAILKVGPSLTNAYRKSLFILAEIEKEIALARKYSYSNRIRYYMGDPKILAAREKLFENLRDHEIPMNMLHQFMPIQYAQIVDGSLTFDPKDLVMAHIAEVMKTYESAT